MTIVIFVHGMEKAGKGFSDQAWTFLQQTYQRLRPGQVLEAERVEFLYNSTFEAFRATPQDALTQLAGLTTDSGIQACIQDLKHSGQCIYTHIHDMLLWRFHTHLRSVITTELGSQLMPFLKWIAGSAAANLVIVPHSLGTAVMNEVIHFVASTGATKYVAIPAIHMLANVSKVLERPELPAYNNPPLSSLCRPLSGTSVDQGAAIQHYFTHWNKLDPIPQVDRFKPSWSDANYHDIPLAALGQGINPHGLETYVQAPEVYLPLLRSISLDPGLSRDLEAAEIAAAQAAWAAGDGTRKALLDRILKDFMDTEELESLLKLLQALKASGF